MFQWIVNGTNFIIFTYSLYFHRQWGDALQKAGGGGGGGEGLNVAKG